MIYIIMGVSGCGKTTVGTLLAERLAVPFLDADDFHSRSNIQKMSEGIPLTNADRLPWFHRLALVLQTEAAQRGAVLACSALTRQGRTILQEAQTAHALRWVHLVGDFQTIQNRLRRRDNHYMSSELLQSQFDTLEQPSNTTEISILATPSEIVDRILCRREITRKA
ncbi:MAG: gluconokinase [Deltaproteobacteria bacterium]|nr:gluconokinase [Deltaproteobacteria bacterium]MBN2674161.1 gluconokinase [Deltaproteobacteria bacterium]